jgi:hypothetical protein
MVMKSSFGPGAMRLSAYETYRTLQEARHAPIPPNNAGRNTKAVSKRSPVGSMRICPESDSASRAIIRNNFDSRNPKQDRRLERLAQQPQVFVKYRRRKNASREDSK